MEAELQLLFLNEYADPITFCTKDVPSRRQVDEAITSNGGEVTDKVGPHTVYLVPEPKSHSGMGMLPPYNTFSVSYIRDSVWAKKLQPLKDYWVHKMVDFDDEKFDPLDVMIGNHTWEDCKKETPSSTSGSLPVNPDDEVFDNASCLTQKPHRVKHKGRTSYTVTEKLRILEYINKKKLHDKVNGNVIWQRMEAKGVCPGRTWQSMREHFRRHIIHQLDQFPSHLSDGFRHSSQLHGFCRRPAPASPPPQPQSSYASDEDTDIEDTQLDERDSWVEHTKAGDFCGRSVAHRLTQDERERESKEEETHRSSHGSTRKENRKESVREGRYFICPPPQTDENGENANQNNQVTMPASQEVRTEEERKRGSREEGTDLSSQAKPQKEKRSESVKKSRHFILPPVLTDVTGESENLTSQITVPVPQQVRTDEERQGKQKSRDEIEETSISMLHSDTEEMETEKLLNEEGKKAACSKSCLNADSEERNECEMKQKEFDMDSPSILTSRDTFLMDRHFVLQESQGFSVNHLLPVSRGTKKKDSKSSINSQVKYHRDEQQEPDSSIEILEEPEEWLRSSRSAQSQLQKSSKSCTNQVDLLHSLSTQKGQETPLTVPSHQLSNVVEENESASRTPSCDTDSSLEAPICGTNVSQKCVSARPLTRQTLVMEDKNMNKENEEREEEKEKDESAGKEISQSSKHLTSIVTRNCIQNVLNDTATQEKLCKAVEPLSASSETSTSPEVLSCDTNTSQHHKSERPLSGQTLVQESHKKVIKESEESKEEREEEESSGKEISQSSQHLASSMIHDCVRCAVNDKAIQEKLCKAIHPVSASGDTSLSPEVLTCGTNVSHCHISARPPTKQTLVLEEDKKVRKESEEKQDKKEEDESSGDEVSDPSKHLTSGMTQDCIRSAVNDKAIREELCKAICPSSTSVMGLEGQENAQENQNLELDSEEDGEEQGGEIEVVVEEVDAAEEEEEETEVEVEEVEEGKAKGDEEELDDNDDEVDEEDEDEEKKVVTRKRNQEKLKKQRIKQQPSHPSGSLRMKTRRMKLSHSSSHTASDSPGTSRSEPRQHTHEERAQPHLKSSPKSRITGTYTVEEDLAIISYIEKEDAYDRVAGRAFWEEMASNFFSGRTWQSLKERFRKRIMTNLHMYTAHGLKDKTILRLERRVTMKTGSSKEQKQKHCRQKRESCLQRPTAQSGAGCKQGRRAKGVSSSESEEESISGTLERVSRMKRSSCREKNKTNKESSCIKLRGYRNSSQQTESEDSDTEESLMEGKRQSHIAGQPHHAEGKWQQQQQHQGHAKMERTEAAKRRGKVTLATPAHAKLKKGQSSIAITSKPDKFKEWKLKVLRGALGKIDMSKTPHAFSKSHRSEVDSSSHSAPISRHTMHQPFHKKRRLLDPHETFMSPLKTPIFHSSGDLPKNIIQQRKDEGDGSQVNTESQRQCKQLTVAWRSDSGDDSDNQEWEYIESEARGTTSRANPALESDMDESDQGSLPDLGVNIAPSPHQSKIYSKDEKEEDNSQEEDEDETSHGSDCLFEIESESE